MIRRRSAYPKVTLSKPARNRTGAGWSGSASVHREPGDPVPEPDVRQLRVLPLQADEEPQHVHGCRLGPRQQQLPLERGPVEHAIAEHRHADSLPTIAASS